ncbi:MAG: hypothetical protein IPJ77_06360 [Planctomycetes bacterium]|nr:hypothetical protein [Planctomycetota bacterium]
MKKQLLLLAVPAVLLSASAALVQGAFELKPDKDNVVASRIEGVWVLHEDETHHIGGEKRPQGFAFVRDDKAAGRIPAKHKELLAHDLYLAGEVQIERDTFPFVLTTAHGNPRVVVFRPAAGDAYATPQAFNVMLCPAMEKSKDKLFVGGDKNDRPFSVYVRKDLAPDKGG